MNNFAMPISVLMSSPVATVAETASLSSANQLLHERGVSSVAVLDAAGRAVGVLSRTDLLRVGRLEARTRDSGHEGPVSAAGAAHALLTFPEGRTVAEVMKHEMVALPPDAPVSSAARTMVQKRIHRVFVMDGGALVGVFSTKDVLVAIRDKRHPGVIADAMSTPVFTIPLTAPLSLATDRLEKARVSGLCVVDESDWPVGTFTQTEAIAARDVPAETPIEEVMSYAMLCIEVHTPLYRAAGYAHATRARRVLAVEGRHLKGVLTGLDFARVAGESL